MSAAHPDTALTEPAAAGAAQRLADDAPFRRALVVANPIAGRGKGENVALEVGEGLRRMGATAEVFARLGRADVRDWLHERSAEADLVVVVGGDGTLRDVLEGLVDARVPVGLLPMGTGNVFASELQLPRDVHRALEIFRARRTVELDVARVNGHLSFLVTGVGFDGLTVREFEARRNGPSRRWDYGPAVLRALKRYRPPRLSVEIDGRRLRQEYAVALVCNNQRYAGVLRLAPDSRLDDGLFEVYLMRNGSPLRLLASAARGLFAPLPGRNCELYRAHSVRVTSDEPVPYEVDGDYRGETPVKLDVAATQYRILVP